MPDCCGFADKAEAVLPLHESEFGRRERQLIDALAEYGVLPAGPSPLTHPAAVDEACIRSVDRFPTDE
ncbi:MAG TPA: hypothetical protein VM689_08280 [Aliidongia sp.]|nr:hypothetical protein [Aliidongia sp.]